MDTSAFESSKANNVSDDEAKADRAIVTPLSHRLPICSAYLRRLGSSPAARRNLDPKRETVSSHSYWLAPIRCRIGVVLAVLDAH